MEKLIHKNNTNPSCKDGLPTKKEVTKDKKYVDDMTMMMAWQNHCWMNYTQKLHQQTFLQYIQNLHVINQYAQQITQYSNTVQHQQQQPTEVEDTSLNRVVKLASIKSRILAEVIDFLLLACIKVFVIQLLYGDSYMEHFNFILIIDENTSFTDLEWMLGQALLFRLVVVAYEGYMLSGTLPFSKGSTIGKNLLGIKVIHSNNVEDVDLLENTVRCNPNKPLGASRSCLRSLFKNMSISFFFPMLLPILIFNQNRLLYDCAVNSLVIEKDLPAQ